MRPMIGWIAAVALGTGIASAQPAAADKTEALSAAARRGDAAAVTTLLDDGVDVNTKFRYGVTALIYACDHGHVDVVKVLVERGADVNVKDTFYGATPLLMAVSPAQTRKPGHIEIAKLLLARGAGPKDDALMAAVSGTDVEMTRAVLEVGGFSAATLTNALEAATASKAIAIVGLLEAAGARPAPKVDVPAEQLARFAGRYRSLSGNELTFTVTDGTLTGGPAGTNLTLAPTDPTTFRVIGAPGVTVAFEAPAAADKASGLTLTQNGSPAKYARVEDK